MLFELTTNQEIEAVVRDTKFMGRMINGFAGFLKNRWQTDLPEGANLSLMPPELTINSDFDYFSHVLEPIKMALLDLAKRVVCSGPDAVAEFLGPIDKRMMTILEAELALTSDAFFAMRPDIVVSTGGVPKIIEMNLQTGLGGLFEMEQMWGLFLDVPAFKELIVKNEYQIETPIKILAQHLESRGNKRLAVVDGGFFACYSSHLAEYLNRYLKSVKVNYCLAAELSPTETGKLSLDGQTIDSVLLNVSPSYYGESWLEHAFHNAQVSQRLSPMLGRIVSSKLALARLYLEMSTHTDHPLKHLLEYIAPTVPLNNWQTLTAAFSESSHELVETKDQWVLKLPEGQGAETVVVGKFVSTAKWTAALEANFNNQERIASVQKYIPSIEINNYVWNNDHIGQTPANGVLSPFVFGGKYCWGIRMAPSSSTNPIVSPLDNNASVIPLLYKNDLKQSDGT